jgi:hypothetical protein
MVALGMKELTAVNSSTNYNDGEWDEEGDSAPSEADTVPITWQNILLEHISLSDNSQVSIWT